MTATLQREHWNGQPTYLGDLFRVGKARGDKTLSAVCKLWTHALGWEVRLEISGDLQRSEVFRSQGAPAPNRRSPPRAEARI